MSELILPTIGAVVAILGLTVMLYPGGKRKRIEKPKREESDFCIPCDYDHDCIKTNDDGIFGKSACLEDREDEYSAISRIFERWNPPPLPESCYVGDVDAEPQNAYLECARCGGPALKSKDRKFYVDGGHPVRLCAACDSSTSAPSMHASGFIAGFSSPSGIHLPYSALLVEPPPHPQSPGHSEVWM